MNVPFLFLIYHNLSCSSLVPKKASHLPKKSVTVSIFQSLKFLLNWKFHPCYVQTSATLTCLFTAKSCISANILFKLKLPNHLSSQNEVLIPFPTLMVILIFKRGHKILMDFHWLTPYGVRTSFVIHTFFSPYFS